MNASQVIVSIPFYKEIPTENERLALKQAQEVLNAYQLCYIVPEGLDLTHYHLPSSSLIERFAAPFFESIKGYNQLMMSAQFYERFSNYQYILLYQLDAYVFEDQLLHWCEKGYDYIGAPWIVAPPKAANAKKPLIDMGAWLEGRVGNGGFSLRRVEAHLKACKRLGLFLRFFPKNEDFFWSFIVPKLIPSFKIPKASEALAFAFELEPNKAFEQNGQKLPFGCHAWEKYEPEFWAKFIPFQEKK